jgi:drug/metabolite transporter (DMT)-like permease
MQGVAGSYIMQIARVIVAVVGSFWVAWAGGYALRTYRDPKPHSRPLALLLGGFFLLTGMMVWVMVSDLGDNSPPEWVRWVIYGTGMAGIVLGAATGERVVNQIEHEARESSRRHVGEE